MPYSEPVIQSWDVKYVVNLNAPGGGWLRIESEATDSGAEALNDVAIQAALDLLIAAGFTLDSGTKGMPAGQTITPTPPE